MDLFLWVLLAVLSLYFWLKEMNKNYFVLSFFSPRVKTKDGRPVESIAPVAKGKTIFGNGFDLYGKSDAEMFQHSRAHAKKIRSSYIEYGMGMAIYNVIDPEVVELVLNDQNLITKSVIYDFLHPALRTGLLTSTDKKWHSRRKILTPTFHFNILAQFEEIFKTESLKFVEQFRGASEISISVSELIPRFTLNSICETAMGVKLDDMAEKGDNYRKNFALIEKRFLRRISNPFYWNNTTYNLFGAKEDKPMLKTIHDFSSEIIAKRRILLQDALKNRQNAHADADDDIYINKKQRFAMLDTLIFAEKDGLIDHQGICEEVDTLMFEGFDTTSMGLIFGLMNMSLYADKQELCYQEVNEFIDANNLDINQIAKLKYLDCFVKDTMRMFPSVPFMGRQVQRKTKLANGLILPADTQIMLHVFDLHRNPKHWDSPNEFRPERFFPENSANRHIYSFIPFSAGQRNCIGQKYALLEVKTLLIVVLKQFKILPLVNPKHFVFNSGITLRTNNNIKVKLVRR